MNNDTKLILLQHKQHSLAVCACIYAVGITILISLISIFAFAICMIALIVGYVINIILAYNARQQIRRLQKQNVRRRIEVYK